MTQPISDELIHALVDGELSTEEAARVETAVAEDAALAGRIERARKVRAAVGAAYAEALSEPPPDRLLAAIRGPAEVVDLAAARARRAERAPRPAVWGAMAASLVAVAFVAGRFWPEEPAPLVSTPAGMVAEGTLANGLEQQLASSQSANAPVKIGVSFRAGDGRYCRTFTLRQGAPIAGLACRGADRWQVQMAVAAPPAVDTAYRTAASETPAPILSAVDEMIRGAPLDAAGEARARSAGWKPAGGAVRSENAP